MTSKSLTSSFRRNILLFAGAGILAVIIDAVFLHSGFHILGFDVPENLEYFAAKLAVIMLAMWLLPRFVARTAHKILLVGFGGSALFSLYYLLTRPDPYGIGDSAVGDYTYGGGGDSYTPPELTMEQNVIIYLVHAVGISVAYGIALAFLHKRKA